MEAYQQRIVDEKTELDDKIKKLSEFIGTSLYLSTTRIDKTDLDNQLNAMVTYSAILERRISRF